MKPPSIAAGLLVQVSGLEPPVSVSKLQVKHLKPENKMVFFYKITVVSERTDRNVVYCSIKMGLIICLNSKMTVVKKFQNTESSLGLFFHLGTLFNDFSSAVE